MGCPEHERGSLRARAAGRLSLAVLRTYVRAMGGPFWFSVLMSWFVLVEGARVAATVWLSVWTDSVDDGSLHGPFYFLGIYTIISGVQVCFCPPTLM